MGIAIGSAPNAVYRNDGDYDPENPLLRLRASMRSQFMKTEKDILIFVSSGKLTRPEEITVSGLTLDETKESIRRVLEERNDIKIELQYAQESDGTITIRQKAGTGQQAQPANIAEHTEYKSQSGLPYDVVAHHNQAIDTIRYVAKQGGLKENVLLHFDTHSDIMTSGSAESIADYINQLAAKDNVSEIYWVIPEWTKHPDMKAANKQIWESMQETGEKHFFGDARKVYTAYVHKESGDLIFQPPVSNADSYRKITIHKIYRDELPDFKNDGRDIILDVDADYFSNLGVDTWVSSANSLYNPSKTDLNESLDMFFADISKIKQPSLVLLSRSPKYTAPEDIPVIEGRFNAAFGKELIRDTFDNYAHGRDKHEDQSLLGGIRDDFVAKNKLIPEYLIESLGVRGFDDVREMSIEYNRHVDNNDKEGEAEKKRLKGQIIQLIGNIDYKKRLYK